MPRQPLMKIVGKSGELNDWSWALPATWAHPGLVSIIGECLMLWPEAELQAAILLANLMKAETDAAISVYLQLRRSTPRQDALKAAAKASLDEKDFQLFNAVLSFYSRIERERNNLAHGCFGTSPDVPDALLWIELQHYARIFIRNRQKTHEEIQQTLLMPPYSEFEPHIFVYRHKDLISIRNEIQELISTMMLFNAYVSSDFSDEPYCGLTREELYDQISLQDPIQEAMAHRQDARAEQTIPSEPIQKSRPSRLVRASNVPLRRKIRRS